MKKIKQAYYYLFYRLYKHAEKSPTIFPYDFIAGLYLEVLMVFIILSLANYYDLIKVDSIDFGNGKSLAIGVILLITVPNYFIFYHKDQWKDIVEEFNKLPKDKNKKAGIVVWSIILLVIANIIFSYYLLSIQAKENQTGPYSKDYILQQKIKDSIDNARYLKEIQDIKHSN